MAFRETIAPETLELLEYTSCKFFFISLGDHPVHQFCFILGYHPFGFKSSHAASQPVRLRWCKTSCDNRDFHRLLLKQGHAQRSAKNIFKFFRWVFHWFFSISAAQ